VREIELVTNALNRLVQAEPGFHADDQQVERVRQAKTNPMLPFLREPPERHAGQEVAEGAGAQRQHDAGLADNRRTGDHEQEQRESEPDAEEDRQRLVLAIAGGDQLLPELAHLRRRPRRHVTDPLERVEHRPAVAGVLGGLLDAATGDFVEPAPDGRREAGRHRHRPRGDEQRGEEKRKQRQQHQHGYTSILITWRIHTKPTVCMTIAPINIVWPMRSLNSVCMCSGLMNDSAMASAAGNASST